MLSVLHVVSALVVPAIVVTLFIVGILAFAGILISVIDPHFDDRLH